MSSAPWPTGPVPDDRAGSSVPQRVVEGVVLPADEPVPLPLAAPEDRSVPVSAPGRGLLVNGVLSLLRESPREGGWWTLTDDRGWHGQANVCPWGQDVALPSGGRGCPGTAGYWRELTALTGDLDRIPSQLTHTAFEAAWTLQTGDLLAIHDARGHQAEPAPGDAPTLWRGEVFLRPQDPHSPAARHARGWLIHQVPEGIDFDTWCGWFLGQQRATLIRRRPSDADWDQDTALGALRAHPGVR